MTSEERRGEERWEVGVMLLPSAEAVPACGGGLLLAVSGQATPAHPSEII